METLRILENSENSVIPGPPPGRFPAPCSAILSLPSEPCYSVYFGHSRRKTLKNP